MQDPHISKNVAILTGDPITVRMAGPAIRAMNIAEQLCKIHEVKLISFTKAELNSPYFEIVRISPSEQTEMRAIEKWADVLLVQGFVLDLFPALLQTKKTIVVDLYDPMHLEQLQQAKGEGEETWISRVSDATAVINEQLIRGDYFVCASPRQRDFWLGQLSAFGRINPLNFMQDKHLRKLIDELPFGISSTAPLQTSHALKGQVPGIDPDDKLLVWAGGLYDWFDPETLIRAVDILHEDWPNLRLFFMGTAHPHPGVPEMPVVEKSRSLASDLGLLGKHVFFNESWVEYADRANFLLDADIGVSTHFDHIETEFSFRTRMLDYIWAGLPMVSTKGDYFADLIETRGLGAVVEPENPLMLAREIGRLLSDDDATIRARENIIEVQPYFYWEKSVLPLLSFIRGASWAPDRTYIEKNKLSMSHMYRKNRKHTLFEQRIRQFLIVTRTQGLIVAIKKAMNQ